MKVIAYGRLDTIVWTPRNRLVKRKTCIGDHTEIERLEWI